MLRYTLKSALAAKGRLLLTAAAIVLGVGMVTGTFVLTDSARAAADAAYAEPDHRVSVVVRGARAGEGEILSDITGELFGDPMPAAVVGAAARVPGVAAAVGVITGDAQLIGRDGHVAGGGRAPLGRSIDPSFARGLRAGRVPSRPGEVVIDQRTAREQRFGVGDRVRVIVSGGEPRAVTVVGILDSPELPGSVALVGYDPVTAPRLLAQDSARISYLEVHADAGVGELELRDRVAAALGPGYQAFTETALAAERARNATPTESGNSQIFLVASIVALLAGIFLIRNTFTVILASRTRELALLRCVGASRGQLRRSVLLQAAVVGALASLAGLVVGIGLAWGLGVLLHSADEAIVDVNGGIRVLPRTIAVALAVGAGTAVLSAWGPARRVTRVPPVTAQRGDVFSLDRRAGRFRAVAGTALTLAGVGLLLAGATSDPVESAYLVAGVSAAALGVLTLGPLLARSLSRLLGAPIRVAWGAVGAIASANAARSPRRTSATMLPLVLGLALVTFLTTLAASTKASAAEGLDRTLRADYRLRSAGAGIHQPMMSPQVARRLANLPELAAVAAFHATAATVAGQASGVTATDPRQLGQVLSLPATGVALSDLEPGEIAVSLQVADRRGLALGAPVTVSTSRGQRVLAVRAIYDTSSLDDFVRQELPVEGDYLITPADFQHLAGGTGLTAVLARKRGGVTQAAARAAIERAIPDYPNVEIVGGAELRRRATRAIDPALRLFYSLLGLAIVVGLLGVVNTLALSIFERARELGLLRAIGMSRHQVRSMIRLEALIIAAIGTVVGLGLGALVGWAVSRDLDLPATIPLGPLAVLAVAAVAVAVLGAALPARRAARLDLLHAIATE
jgi:putative ABC transport system permease protein